MQTMSASVPAAGGGGCSLDLLQQLCLHCAGSSIFLLERKETEDDRAEKRLAMGPAAMFHWYACTVVLVDPPSIDTVPVVKDHEEIIVSCFLPKPGHLFGMRTL